MVLFPARECHEAFLLKCTLLALQRKGDLKVEGNKIVPADMSGQPADEDIVF